MGEKRLKMKRKYSHTIIIAAILFCMLMIFGTFSERLRKNIFEREILQMQRVSELVAKLVNLEIERCVDIIDLGEDAFENYSPKDLQAVIDVLDDIKEEDKYFDLVGITNCEGQCVTSKGRLFTIKDKDLLRKMLTNDFHITNLMNENEFHADSLLISVPILKEASGELLGAVFANYPVEGISQRIGFTDDPYRYFQIIDDQGNYISRTDDNYDKNAKISLWEELKKYELLDGVTPEEIERTMKNKESSSLRFRYQNKLKYVSYMPLGINNWYIYSIVVEGGLKNYSEEVRTESAFYLLWFAILTLILVFIIKSDNNKNKIIKKQNRELMVKTMLFEMIMSKTHDMPFEINLKEGKFVRYFSNRNDGGNKYHILDDFSPDTMLKLNLIKKEGYFEYKKVYDEVFDENISQIAPITLQLRMRGEWHWVRINILHVNEDNLVGFIENVDEHVEQKRITAIAFEKASHDTLTGLLNREAFIKKTENSLQKCCDEKICALYLLDIDRFKEINDNFGHIFGDKVLNEVGVILQAIVGKNDFVGRLGGDEFVVLLTNVDSIEAIEKCAQKFNNALEKDYILGDKVINISASIGIAINKSGMKFIELYDKADKALYEVKKNGKNGYYIIK